ncbi:MAG: hypothetical protein HGB10_08655 [Coriobacteriia bacterium]|nr:hypothetical protein [Coriobacteriia bacterium]
MNPAELNLNPIDQINPIVIVAVMLIVVATYFALRRVYVMPYLRVMEERERFFESADASYAQAGERVATASAALTTFTGVLKASTSQILGARKSVAVNGA